MQQRRSWLRWLIALLIVLAALMAWRTIAGNAGSDETRPERALNAAGLARSSGQLTGSAQEHTKLEVSRRGLPQPGLVAPLPVPLPPLNAKVADVLMQLKDAADHGDSRAACRLGVELSRCYHAHSAMTLVDTESVEASKESDPGKRAELQRSTEQRRKDLQPDLNLCEGVGAADYNEAWSYLVQSASAGNAEAAGEFYMAPPLAGIADDSELERVWLDHREEYRDMAIRGGNVYVLNAAAVLEAMGIGPWGARVNYPPSFYNAAKFITALEPLDGRADRPAHDQYANLLRSKLSPQESEDAQREGSAIREKYFQGVRPVSDPQQSGRPRPERCPGS